MLDKEMYKTLVVRILSHAAITFWSRLFKNLTVLGTVQRVCNYEHVSRLQLIMRYMCIVHIA